MNRVDSYNLSKINDEIENSVVLKRAGKITAAKRILENCLEKYKNGNQAILAPLYKSLGKLLYIEGEYVKAEECYIKAIFRYSELDVEDQVMECFILLGACDKNALSPNQRTAYASSLRGEGLRTNEITPTLIKQLWQVGQERFKRETHRPLKSAVLEQEDDNDFDDEEVEEIDIPRFFDELAGEVAKVFSTEEHRIQLLDNSIIWLINTQKQYSGDEYFNRLEANVVKFRESAKLFNFTLACYLYDGYDNKYGLHSDTPVEQYIDQQNVLGEKIALMQLDFIRFGCNGCEIHKQHGHWEGYKKIRANNQLDLCEELEFNYIYYRAMLVTSCDPPRHG